jgi:hypothetical protein
LRKSNRVFAMIAIIALVVGLTSPVSAVFAADPPPGYPPEYVGDKTPLELNPDGSKKLPTNAKPLDKEHQQTHDKKRI